MEAIRNSVVNTKKVDGHLRELSIDLYGKVTQKK